MSASLQGSVLGPISIWGESSSIKGMRRSRTNNSSLVWCETWAGLHLAYKALHCIAWTILSQLRVCFHRHWQMYKNRVSRALPATRVSSEELKQSGTSHRDLGELPYKLIFASLLSNTFINDMGGSIIAFWTTFTLTKRVNESDKDHASPVWSICKIGHKRRTCLMIPAYICQQRIPHTEGVHGLLQQPLPRGVVGDTVGDVVGDISGWSISSVMLTGNTVSPATRGTPIYLVVAQSVQYCVCFWVSKHWCTFGKYPLRGLMGSRCMTRVQTWRWVRMWLTCLGEGERLI